MKVCCDFASPVIRPLERVRKFSVEIFLKTRNRHIEAQDFPGKGILGAKLPRPRNPPLPFALHAAIRHGAIIGPRRLPRNAGHRPRKGPRTSRGNLLLWPDALRRLTRSHAYGTMTSCR